MGNSDKQVIIDNLCEDLLLDSDHRETKEDILLEFIRLLNSNKNTVILIQTNVIKIFQSVEHRIRDFNKNPFLEEILSILVKSLSKEIIKNAIGFRLVKLATESDNHRMIQILT